MDKVKKANNKIITNIVWLIGIGIAISIGIFFILQLPNSVPHTEIQHTSQIISCISIGLTGVTIYLLYMNYNQQKIEFAEIHKASMKANDLQLILFEKQLLDRDYEKFVQNMRDYEREVNFATKKFQEISLNMINNNEEQAKKIVLDFIEPFAGINYNIFAFIIKYNKKLEQASKLLTNEESIHTFSNSIDSDLINLINNIYDENVKIAIQKLIDENPTLNLFDKELFMKLTFIIGSTPILKKIVKNYMET